MTAPSRDEFQAWQNDPVTQFVMEGVRAFAAKQQEQWMLRSWVGGNSDPMALGELRTRADAYQGFSDLTVEQAYGANGLDPPPIEETSE